MRASPPAPHEADLVLSIAAWNSIDKSQRQGMVKQGAAYANASIDHVPHGCEGGSWDTMYGNIMDYMYAM